jgi:hypothetical protein
MTFVEMFKGKFFIVNQDGKPQGFDAMGPFSPENTRFVELFDTKSEAEQVIAALGKTVMFGNNMYLVGEIQSGGYVVYP